MKLYDVVILGGGASGLMCAAHLEKRLKVAIIEGNDKLAKKLKISGGGKCNITNKYVDVENYDGDENLIRNALEVFSKENLLDFLQKNGVKPVLRKGRYYFCKESSEEIINLLKAKIRHVEIKLGTQILEVSKTSEGFEIKTSKGVLHTKRLVIATGGASYKTLGASDIGVKIAKSLGLQVKEFEPSLVGLTLQKEQFWMKELSGLSCYVHIKVAKRVLKEEMLFAHKGISGPAVLSASLHWKKGNIGVDFLPNDKLEKLSKGSKKILSSLIPLPKRLSKALLKALDVPDIEYNRLNPHAKERLLKIHDYRFAPAGNFGFTKAEASRGGVLGSELEVQTMQTKNQNRLYCIGEVVDVTGELGGYNFQWAFSSAVVCANGINNT